MLNQQVELTLYDCLKRCAGRVKSPVRRALTFVRIAQKLSSRGRTLADQYLLEALQLSKSLTVSEKGLVVCEISYTHALQGRMEEADQFVRKAMAIADEAAEEIDRGAIFYRLAQVFCELGQYERAESLLPKLMDKALRGTVSMVVIKARIKAGDIAKALELSAMIPEPFEVLADSVLRILEKEEIADEEFHHLRQTCL